MTNRRSLPAHMTYAAPCLSQSLLVNPETRYCAKHGGRVRAQAQASEGRRWFLEKRRAIVSKAARTGNRHRWVSVSVLR